MRALFVGRFQPLHWGHVKVIEWLLTHYDEVVVAIGSADKAITHDNPFTPGERHEMVRRHFRSSCRVHICAVPDTDGSSFVWAAYLRHWCPQFHVVYSNNPHVAASLAPWGLEVRQHPHYPGYSGTEVRRAMAAGDPRWREMVPPAVAEVVEEVGGLERLRALYKSL